MGKTFFLQKWLCLREERIVALLCSIDLTAVFAVNKMTLNDFFAKSKSHFCFLRNKVV